MMLGVKDIQTLQDGWKQPAQQRTEKGPLSRSIFQAINSKTAKILEVDAVQSLEVNWDQFNPSPKCMAVIVDLLGS